MKSIAFPTLTLLAALLLGGCSTIESRIQEKSATFAALDSATQEKIRKGAVAVGYSSDAVYIALGRPDQEIHRTTREGESATWIYRSYHEDYEGTARVGYRRFVVRDDRTGQPIIVIEPIYSDIYSEHAEERIRVIFNEGKVSAIEEVKN